MVGLLAINYAAGEVRRNFFSSSRGDLMAAEDSEDEGGVVGVRYDH